MLLDSITLVPSAQVKNFKIESAAAFPASPFEGQSLILTVQDGVHAPGAYTYVAGTWQPQGDITAVIAGEGLVGGGAAGAITVEIDPTIVALKSDLVGLGGGGGAVDSVSVGTGLTKTGTATDPVISVNTDVIALKTDIPAAPDLSAYQTKALNDTAYATKAEVADTVKSATAGTGITVTGTAADPIIGINSAVVALKSDLVGLGGGGGGAVESIIVRSGVSNVGSATNLILEADQTVMATKADLAPYIHTIQPTSNDNQTGNGAGAVLSMQGDVKNGHLWTMRSLRAGLGIRLTINGAIGDAVITSELDSSNTYTKTAADAEFLSQDTATANFLTKADALTTYAKIEDVPVVADYYTKTVSDATFEVKQTQGFGLSKSGATVSVATAATPYDIESSVFGLPAADAIVLLPFKFPRTVKFPNNFAGSVAQSIQAATASSAFTVSKNGVTVGTFTFAASSNVGVFASVGGTEIVFAAGDVMMIRAPAVKDVTLANISYTLCGNLQTV